MALDVTSPDDSGTVELTEWTYQVRFEDGSEDWMDIGGRGDHEAMAMAALRQAPAEGETSRVALCRTVSVTFGEWKVAREVITR